MDRQSEPCNGQPYNGKGMANGPKGLLGLSAAIGLLFFSRISAVFGGGPADDIPPLCGTWHRGATEGHPIDLDRLTRNYEELKVGLSRTLSASLRAESAKATLGGYDAGLPACRGRARRRLLPEAAIPAELLGRKLAFIRIEEPYNGEGKHPVLPDLVKVDPAAVVLVLSAGKLSALSDVEKAVGRSVRLAPHGLAQALGVRCGPALVEIAPNGEVEVHENP